MDIKHGPHKHRDGSEHKTFRIYKREKVNQKYRFIPLGMMCKDCGTVLTE